MLIHSKLFYLAYQSFYDVTLACCFPLIFQTYSSKDRLIAREATIMHSLSWDDSPLLSIMQKLQF